MVLNDYNLHEDIKDAGLGKLPDHLAFGLHNLQKFGFEYEHIKLWEPGFAYHLDNWLIRKKPFIPLGRIETQLKVLQRLKTADLILSLKETECSLLHYLKALGCITTPLITLVHHPQNIGRLNNLKRPLYKAWHRGATATLLFSNNIPLIEGSSRNCIRVPWGPDVDYYDSLQPHFGYAIKTAGKSGRDFSTFIEACKSTNTTAEIMCPPHDLSNSFQNLPKNINCVIGWQSSNKIHSKLRDSLAIAIPLLSQEFTSGLTSFCDALGLGKAVFMPKNVGIDLDIEELGIGKFVTPNNHLGWSNVLNWIKLNREETINMGKQARQFAGQFYNSEVFIKKIADILSKCVKETSYKNI